jgi:hypothetical protein
MTTIACIIKGHDWRLVWPPLCECKRCGKAAA